MDLIKLIDQNVECVATPNGRYLKRSEVFEVVEKFTSTNTGSPKCSECYGWRVVPKDSPCGTRYEVCPVCKGFGTLRKCAEPLMSSF